MGMLLHKTLLEVKQPVEPVKDEPKEEKVEPQEEKAVKKTRAKRK